MAEKPDRSGGGSLGSPTLRDRSLNPYWEKLDPKEGLPTWEALYHFVDREKAVALYRFAAGNPEANCTNRPTKPVTFRIKGGTRSVHEVIDQLVQKLRTGELRARGFVSHAAIDAPRQDIHRDRWGDLELDARASRACGPGFVISQILVFAAEPSQAEGWSAKKQYSSVALRAWYIGRLERLLAADEKSTRDEDYLAANADFAGRVPKRPLGELRKELAPASWTQGGRPKKT